MKSNTDKAAQSSQKARLSAARLAAVQAVYQMLANDQKAQDVLLDHKEHRIGKPVDGIDLVMPDGSLFSSIIQGVEARRSDLDLIIAGGESAPQSDVRELLLRSIMLCGAYELMAHHDTDAPIIINDYLNVTHAFYDQGEVRLINGTLDRIRKSVRDGESQP